MNTLIWNNSFWISSTFLALLAITQVHLCIQVTCIFINHTNSRLLHKASNNLEVSYSPEFPGNLFSTYMCVCVCVWECVKEFEGVPPPPSRCSVLLIHVLMARRNYSLLSSSSCEDSPLLNALPHSTNRRISHSPFHPYEASSCCYRSSFLRAQLGISSPATAFATHHSTQRVLVVSWWAFSVLLCKSLAHLPSLWA